MKKWLGALTIAMSIPSTVAVLVYGISLLVESGIVSMTFGYSIFFLVILGMLWLMVTYAVNKKN